METTSTERQAAKASHDNALPEYPAPRPLERRRPQERASPGLYAFAALVQTSPRKCHNSLMAACEKMWEK